MSTIHFWLIPYKLFIIGFHTIRKFFHICRYYCDLIISKLFYKSTMIILKDNKLKIKKENLCIFSHYDPHNLIDPYVIYYLNALSQYCNIIFVTTCDKFPLREINKINHLCKRIIKKSNRGLDFSSYKCGLFSEKSLLPYQKILFVNDSVYGPFFDLRNIIHYGDNNLDMWGATDSYMIKYHIQSYFIVFSRSVFLTKEFNNFWNNIVSLGLKNNIIIRYEIGMSQYFLHHQFKLSAYSACHKKANYINFDPSHHHWEKIIIENHHPFIKRILVRDNPHKVLISNWQIFLENLTKYDTSLIKNHLTRTTL